MLLRLLALVTTNNEFLSIDVLVHYRADAFLLGSAENGVWFRNALLKSDIREFSEEQHLRLP